MELSSFSINLGVFAGSLIVICLYCAILGYSAATSQLDVTALDVLPLFVLVIAAGMSGYGVVTQRGDLTTTN